jgi:HSP20 family molecular chaperone IbpA
MGVVRVLLENEFTSKERPEGRRPHKVTDGVFETDSLVRIEIELPGVSIDRIRIDATGTRVFVRVDRGVTFIGDEDTLYMIDDRFSGFERGFDIPATSDLCAAHAYFSRDTLTIIIPKREVRRSIPIEERPTAR